MQKSKVKIIVAAFSLPLLAFSFGVFAQSVSTPQIKHFYASPQSRYYLGDADQDGVPDFAAGKAMEFEVSACDPELALLGRVTFGDGGEYTFSAVNCNQRIVLHTYGEPRQEIVVLLDVENEAGRSAIQAIKVDIVPLPPDEEEAPTGQPPVPVPTPAPELPPPPLGRAGSGASLAAGKVLTPGGVIDHNQPASLQQAQASLAGSALLGAFVTGALALLFLVILIYAVRALFNRS